ncbi:MAG: hypothetical protein RLZZ526_1734 [Actinomycetota bacterium]|jgi:hypothetical protein
MSDELRDQLPDDLNAVDFAGAYEFPDNSRRRIPAAIYGVLAAGAAVAWMSVDRESSVIVNDGALLGAVILGAMAVISFTSGWRMSIDEREALVRATASVGFVVGHASAQQVWRGVRSRPTWRIFCYSAEEPPLQRGLVLVDAVDGSVVEVLVEENPDLASHAPDDQVK